MPDSVVQVVTTVAAESTAASLARGLVEARLAACVQIDGPITSIYRWQGAVETAIEWRLTAKTTAAAVPALLARLRADHPYQQPEILVLPAAGADPGYASWVAAETAPA